MKSFWNIYIRIIALGLIIVLGGCTKDSIEEIDTRKQEYIGFYGGMSVSTRSYEGRGASSQLSYMEQEWELTETSQLPQTKGRPVDILTGLNVGMFVHPYKNGGIQTAVMQNHEFEFINNEDMKSISDLVLWETVSGTDSLHVYGYAPIISASSTNISTTTSNGVTTISYTVPSDVANQTDIIATDIKKVASDYNQNIPLTFRHILTGVRFKTGFDCQVLSLKVVNVFGKGDFTVGHSWGNHGQPATTFTIPIPSGGKNVEADTYISDDENILMMIPQEIPDSAYVEMRYINENGDEGIIKASLKGLKWEQGVLVSYTLHEQKAENYVYFDLNAGNVTITPTSYAGAVFVNGEATTLSKSWNADENPNYHYYIYQSTDSNKASTGYATSLTDVCRLPYYDPVTINGEFWSEYISNNSNVEAIIEAWDTAANINAEKSNSPQQVNNANGAVRKVGRSSTGNYINVSGDATNKFNCEITIDNIYSRYQLHGATRTSGGLTFTPKTDYSSLTVNMIGDNRFGNIHYYSGKNSKGDLLMNNKLILQGSGSVTVACVDFYKGKSNQSSSAEYNADNVTGYFSNYWCSAIGGDDGSHGNSIGITIKSGTIFAGTTQAENCTAIGGGGNDRGYVDIEGGSVTAVATTTGTAIGGGIGFMSRGGIGYVKIKGGSVFAYNHANEWEIPSAAIGSAGSWQAGGGSGTIEISGGYVYAQTALGTAIGGGSSKTLEGGSATVTISGNSYVIAKSISAIDKYNNELYPAGSGIGGGTGGVGQVTVSNSKIPAYGGSAKIIIKDNPTIRTGSIGGGKTNNPAGKIGHAEIDISGGDISAQFVMAGGADANKKTTFTMTGGTISNSDVRNNEFYHVIPYGGAVYMEDGTFTMTAGKIRNCFAEVGGAVYIKKDESAVKTPEFLMSGGTIEDCTAISHGGAVHLEGGNVTLSGGTIQENLAQNGNGGGIHIAEGNFEMSGNAQVVYNSALSNNLSYGSGGGIYITSPSSDVLVDIIAGTISNNTCSKNGGGICVEMSSSDDAPSAIVNIGPDGSSNITDPNISSNKAVLFGGGLYAIGKNAMITINGGRIMGNRITNYLPNSDVTNEGGTVLLKEGNVTHVVVTFDVNTTDPTAKVEGASTAQQKIVSATNSFLVAPTPQRDLYNFVGWNTRPDGKGFTYVDGQLMNISEPVTLYAQWQAQ